SLAGSILGLIIGPLTIPYLFYPTMSSTYSLPSWGPSWNISFFAVAALMVVSSVLISYISVKGISDESPAETIRPKAPKMVASGLVERTKIWKRFSFNERWNYRDAKRNKTRAFMSVFGVFACAMLVMSAFGMSDSINDVEDWQYNQIYNFNTKLILEDNITDAQLDHILAETDGEGMMEESIELKYKGNKKAGTLTVMNKSEYYRVTDGDRNYIDLDPEGIAISDKMAEVLGLEVGDKVRWHVAGDPKWIDSEITETYTVPYGQGMIMTPKTFDKEGGDDYNYSTNVILTKKNVNKNYTGVSSITTREDIQNGWNTMTQAMDMMITVLTTFAILLAVVVLYYLGLLSFTEIQRELATLKVLGFNSKSLRRLLLTQNLWFSTIGFILAIPGAYILMGIMMGSTGDEYCFPINIYLWNFVVSFLITFGLSVLVNLAFSRKIKKVNMVESLKSNE
ncbi:MAG: FtsX-like permease family protein, partial [Methanobrevibacter sp.]|nr:FtsX-like permease family protein [Methanobrevibacter sp.]